MGSPEAIAKLIASRFIARSDVMAVQHRDGSYHPEREPFTREHLLRHLAGEISLGHYLINADDRCKLFALDLDLEKEGVCPLTGEVIAPRDVWAGPDTEQRQALRKELFTLAVGLACGLRRAANFPITLAASGGKGVHVYGLTGSIAAAHARAIPLALLEHLGVYGPVRGRNFWKHLWAYPNVSIEVFPKQDSVAGGEGLGNLMRLPLGRNARTDGEAFFLRPDAWEPADPVTAIEQGTVTPEWLAEPAR